MQTVQEALDKLGVAAGKLDSISAKQTEEGVELDRIVGLISDLKGGTAGGVATQEQVDALNSGIDGLVAQIDAIAAGESANVDKAKAAV